MSLLQKLINTCGNLAPQTDVKKIIGDTAMALFFLEGLTCCAGRDHLGVLQRNEIQPKGHTHRCGSLCKLLTFLTFHLTNHCCIDIANLVAMKKKKKFNATSDVRGLHFDSIQLVFSPCVHHRIESISGCRIKTLPYCLLHVQLALQHFLLSFVTFAFAICIFNSSLLTVLCDRAQHRLARPPC